MVRLNKPAQAREGPITDKTGGCNNEASVVERTLAYKPCLRIGELESMESNRWCCLHYKTNLSTGMRKGSVFCSRGCTQERVCSMSG
jgi:hypothetical protein